MNCSNFRGLLILCITCLCCQDIANAQEISSHQWQNRLLIVLADHDTDPQLHKQRSELDSCKEGLDERKLLIYEVLPEKFRLMSPDGETVGWQTGDKLYWKLRNYQGTVEMVLVGLDGGIKLRKAGHLSCRELWATIDSMPMRRAEISRQKATR